MVCFFAENGYYEDPNFSTVFESAFPVTALSERRSTVLVRLPVGEILRTSNR